MISLADPRDALVWCDFYDRGAHGARVALIARHNAVIADLVETSFIDACPQTPY